MNVRGAMHAPWAIVGKLQRSRGAMRRWNRYLPHYQVWSSSTKSAVRGAGRSTTASAKLRAMPNSSSTSTSRSTCFRSPTAKETDPETGVTESLLKAHPPRSSISYPQQFLVFQPGWFAHPHRSCRPARHRATAQLTQSTLSPPVRTSPARSLPCHRKNWPPHSTHSTAGRSCGPC